jgi:hypothetical protein
MRAALACFILVFVSAAAAPSLIQHVRSGKLRVLAEMMKWAPVAKQAGIKLD